MTPVKLTRELGLLEGRSRHQVFRGQSGRNSLHPMTSLRRRIRGSLPEHLAGSLLSSVTAGGLWAGSGEGWF